MKNNIERRTLPAELRADGNKIVGYAAVYNSDSQDLGGFTERLDPGCFDQSIKRAAEEKRKIKAIVNHNEEKILGHTLNSRLKLTPDERGLAVDIDPSDTSYARDLVVNLADENADKMSFAFVALREDWIEEDGKDVRIVKECELYEVSALQGYDPAYQDTSVALRMQQEYHAAKELTEQIEQDEKEQKQKSFNAFDLLQKQMELETLL